MGTGIVGGAIGVYPKVLTVQLPNIWKGKNFKVLVSMKNTAGGVADEWVKRTTLEVVSIDITKATFSVKGYWTSVNANNIEYEKELEFSWLAIGG